ncbi:MAG: hypothetical protein O7G87_14390 [bacterium]|nr:hypothetical protein [bacterium]
MLTGFLTTALEIILILDICGAIVYFVLSGLKKQQDEKENTQPTPSPLSMPATGPVLTPVYQMATAGHDVFSVYAERPSEEPEMPRSFGLIASVKQRITSFKAKLSTYRPSANKQSVQTQEIGTEHRKLGQILDSFKEDM